MKWIKNTAGLVLAALMFSGCSIWEDDDQKPVLKIGVMMPWTGDYASNWDTALDWAVENINLNGGVAGCNIELVKKDLATNDLKTVSEELIADESIKAVIGPMTSAEVFEAAPLFINGKKILMAPVATSANISRAFAGKDYFWRLAEPDISQTKTLLLLAQSGGARKVALITEDSQYGASFEDWFGFFATELGLEVSGMEVIEPGDTDACKTAWESVAANSPDAVIAALNSPAQNAALGKAYREKSRQIRLLFSDAACLPALVENLGTLAENLEGTTLTSDPSSGFDISYKVKYDEYPSAFLANMYDAVMLLSLALEVSGGEGGEALVAALQKVVSGDEATCSWQRDEVGEAIEMLQNGIFPDINGASGSLDYDELYFTDVTSSTYGRWRVDAGQFVVTDFYTSDGKGRISSTSAAYRIIANERQQFDATGTWPELTAKQNNFAILMATSKGWSNYRHQSDVLHAYQLLKQNGFSDDQIILILEDDLAGSPSNALPGVIRNEPEGNNVYENVETDYRLTEINSESLKNIFTGNETTQTPVVLNSTSGDNIFIFTSGHGVPDGMVLEAETTEILTPEYWQAVFEAMNQEKNFRQVFWSLEACYSGTIGKKIATPGVMLMTGANPFETSKAYFYDSEIKNWLADKFAYSINNSISENPEITFSELYEKSFTYVNGSHVSFYNYQNFGNIYDIRLSEFVTP
ncbi:MAG: C13 family peptidase [Tangfeifania sp.]